MQKLLWIMPNHFHDHRPHNNDHTNNQRTHYMPSSASAVSLPDRARMPICADVPYNPDNSDPVNHDDDSD